MFIQKSSFNKIPIMFVLTYYILILPQISITAILFVLTTFSDRNMLLKSSSGKSKLQSTFSYFLPEIDYLNLVVLGDNIGGKTLPYNRQIKMYMKHTILLVIFQK